MKTGLGRDANAGAPSFTYQITETVDLPNGNFPRNHMPRDGKS